MKGTNKWVKINEQFHGTTTGVLMGYRFNSSWRGGSGDEKETITSVSFDDVGDSAFTLPDAIEALLAKKGS